MDKRYKLHEFVQRIGVGLGIKVLAVTGTGIVFHNIYKMFAILKLECRLHLAQRALPHKFN